MVLVMVLPTTYKSLQIILSSQPDRVSPPSQDATHNSHLVVWSVTYCVILSLMKGRCGVSESDMCAHCRIVFSCAMYMWDYTPPIFTYHLHISPPTSSTEGEIFLDHFVT